MPAALQTWPQLGPLTQQQPNLGIVQPHQLAHPLPAMPIRLELELLLDSGCYKPRR